MSGSPFREKCRSLQEHLKHRFQKIEQPSIDPPDEDSFRSARWYSEEVAEIIKARRYMLYTDDAIFRLYANPPSENPPSICTLDLLLAADQAELLSARQVAEKIATLCSWRVGLRIPTRYQYAILPDGLDHTRTIAEGIEMLRADILCNAMFSGIWEFGKEFTQLQLHAGSIISELVRNPANSIHSITALAGFWLSKVRFNEKAPTPPIRLLAVMIVQAALIHELEQPAARRLWSVYRSLTEVEHGNRMEDKEYRESIDILAKETSSADIELRLSGENSMFSRLSKGLTEGTSDSEYYASSYSAERIRQSTQR